jgi:hypothetical protein
MFVAITFVDGKRFGFGFIDRRVFKGCTAKGAGGGEKIFVSIYVFSFQQYAS